MDGILQWHPGVSLASLEKQAILEAFRFYRGNKTMTSQSLGISIRTLDSKLEQYKEDGKSYEERNSERAKQRQEFLAKCRGPAPVGDSNTEIAKAQERERKHAADLFAARNPDAKPDGDGVKNGSVDGASSQSSNEGTAAKTGVLASSGSRLESAKGDSKKQPVSVSKR